MCFIPSLAVPPSFADSSQQMKPPHWLDEYRHFTWCLTQLHRWMLHVAVDFHPLQWQGKLEMDFTLGRGKKKKQIDAQSMCCSATSNHELGTRSLEKMQAMKSWSGVAWRTSFHPLPSASVRNECLDFCHLYPLLSILILTFHKSFLK